MREAQLFRIMARIGMAEVKLVLAAVDVQDARDAAKGMETLNRQLTDLARTDPLTGIANRRVFDTTLATEVQRSARAGLSLSLLLIDIDRFKDFNDRNGHVVGDACLREVGQAISSAVTRPRRPGEAAARDRSPRRRTVNHPAEAGRRRATRRARARCRGARTSCG